MSHKRKTAGRNTHAARSLPGYLIIWALIFNGRRIRVVCLVPLDFLRVDAMYSARFLNHPSVRDLIVRHPILCRLYSPSPKSVISDTGIRGAVETGKGAPETIPIGDIIFADTEGLQTGDQPHVHVSMFRMML